MHLKKLFTKRKTWFILLLILIDWLFFSFSNPDSVASIVLIVGFVLFLVTLYQLLGLGLAGLSVYSSRLKGQRGRLGLTLTIMIGILLMLQSIGQLSSRDALVILVLGVVLYIYTTFVKARPAL